MNPSLVVSIHDVSPHTWQAVERILTELATIGITRTSLLVVPDHHHRGHFLAYPDFCAWLRAREAEGHEMVIHGYYHQREPKRGEGLADKVTTQFYTAGEGEFYDLGKYEAESLISRALADFQRAGLSPCGFVAPAWLLSEEAFAVLQAAGLRHTTRLRMFYDLANHRQIASQSLVYSTRAAWRRMMSLAWNATLYRRLRKKPLLRLGIHPPEIGYPAVWQQILKLAGMAAREREVTTYANVAQKLSA
ncbi:MAG: polysaccharide deacetylase family protein [Chthoniobacteraceae bacterium]